MVLRQALRPRRPVLQLILRPDVRRAHVDRGVTERPLRRQPAAARRAGGHRRAWGILRRPRRVDLVVPGLHTSGRIGKVFELEERAEIERSNRRGSNVGPATTSARCRTCWNAPDCHGGTTRGGWPLRGSESGPTHPIRPDVAERRASGPVQRRSGTRNAADGVLADPPLPLSDHPSFGSFCEGRNWTVRMLNAVQESEQWDRTAVVLTWELRRVLRPRPATTRRHLWNGSPCAGTDHLAVGEARVRLP